MTKLTTRGRKDLPKKDFAGPGRSYPDEDKGHAKAAMARASEFASPSARAKIDANVHRKFPSMGKPAGSVGRELEKRLAARDKK